MYRVQIRVRQQWEFMAGEFDSHKKAWAFIARQDCPAIYRVVRDGNRVSEMGREVPI